MTIKDFFKGKDKVVEVDSFATFQFSRPELPTIIEKKNIPWVLYGKDNNYPKFLNEIKATSAIHNAILEGKAHMMAGNGFLLNDSIDETSSKAVYDALAVDVKKNYDFFLNNPNGEPLYKINHKVSHSYQKNGSFALEVVWNTEFTQIVTIKYINTDNVRAGKMEKDIVSEYYYHRDWSQSNKQGFKPTKLTIFDPKEGTKKDKFSNQIIFVKNGTLEYYGEPSYQGAMSWIKIDSQMGLFHLSNIENGFAPSLVFKFYKKPSSPEAQQQVLDNIKGQYSSAKNAGKAMVFFSDGKELAPDVTPVEVNNIDKQFMLLADQAVQQIMSGHRVTNPLLFGVSTPGKLSGGSELDVSYRIFDNSVVEPDRNALEDVYNLILKTNGIPVTIEINKFNPLQEAKTGGGNAITDAINSLSPLVANKVLESMTEQEIRDLIGLQNKMING